jgi:hypothetical protein
MIVSFMQNMLSPLVRYFDFSKSKTPSAGLAENWDATPLSNSFPLGLTVAYSLI